MPQVAIVDDEECKRRFDAHDQARLRRHMKRTRVRYWLNRMAILVILAALVTGFITRSRELTIVVGMFVVVVYLLGHIVVDFFDDIERSSI
jgi:hypothetical protein